MAKSSNKTQHIVQHAASFRVSVVYGFQDKLKIVILGEILQGDITEGMNLQARLSDGTSVGMWEVTEVLVMDFINGQENNKFISLIVKCKDVSDFKLLQSLRVYDEIIIAA